MAIVRELSFNLEGTISNMGLGVAGTTVRLYDYWNRGTGLTKHFLLEQVTGSKGSFNFDVRKGIYCVEIIPSTQTRFARQSFETIKVTSNTSYNVVLKSGSILSGKVTDPQGNPIGNCELRIFGIEPHVLRVTEPVLEDGSFSVSLPSGTYYVSIQHRQLPVDKKNKKTQEPVFLYPVLEVIELLKDQKKHIVVPELLTFDGLVTNQQGHPVAGAKVIVHSMDAPENVFARELQLDIAAVTGKDGKFECRLKAGSYSVRIEPPADSNLAEKSAGTIVIDQSRNRTFALDQGHRLSGQVRHGKEPISNAMVTVFGVNSRYVRLTDDDGHYSFNLPGGSYEMAVVMQPESLRQGKEELAPWQGNLILSDDVEFDTDLDQGVLVSGRVLDPDGNPRDGVLLAVYATRNGQYDGAGSRQHPLVLGISSSDGTYEFRLQPGSYWLVLNNQPSTGHLIEVAGSRQENNLTVNNICVASFEIVSEEREEPIPNCMVLFNPYNSSGNGTGNHISATLIEPSMTAADGLCTVTMPTGIYSFHIHPPEDSGFADKHIRQLSVMSDMIRRVKLSKKV